MKRLFFGLSPDQQASRQCLTIMKALSAQHYPVIPAANLHVTLLFLGAINAGQEAELMEKAAGIAFPRLTLKFDQLSYWPKPQVLCLIASATDSALQDLAARLKALAENLGIAVENRPYLPHVTLARKAKHPIAMTIEPVVWRAGQFCLFESVTTGNGVTYPKIRCWASQNA